MLFLRPFLLVPVPGGPAPLKTHLAQESDSREFISGNDPPKRKMTKNTSQQRFMIALL